jgi:hypothetical protein
VVTSIIFSKNRPLQLDLTLKTIAKNFEQCTKVIVLYNADPEYSDAYEVLKKEHLEVDWRQQTRNFYKDVLHCASAFDCNNEFICFFTDDCIVYRNIPNLSPMLLNLANDQLKCISLRMGSNIKERQSGEQMIQDLPGGKVYADDAQEWIVWNMLSNPYSSYWCYPMSVDGHIFKRTVMKEMLEELYILSTHVYSDWIQNPNGLESNMQRFFVTGGCNIAAPFLSCVFNSPNNRVQQSHSNRSGDWYQYTPEFLLKKFNEGKRINLENLKFEDIKCPHTEINLTEGLS